MNYMELRNCAHFADINVMETDDQCGCIDVRKEDGLGYCPFINGWTMKKYCKYFVQRNDG